MRREAFMTAILRSIESGIDRSANYSPDLAGDRDCKYLWNRMSGADYSLNGRIIR